MERINKIIVYVLLMFVTSLTLGQDVNISLQISPPYSPYLSDYFSIQNKTLAIITNMGRGSYNLKLIGKIEGDNGVVITTGQNATGARAFALQPGTTKTITGNELGTYFDINNISVSGITKQELISGGGLPEGNYTMCVQAFSVDDNEIVSADEPSGCSAPFSVFSVDPPVIISPLCDGEIEENPGQNIVFSWSPPSRISPNTKYLLRMAEVNPGTRNPNDALLSATSPQFFEKILQTNSYVYSLADPRLKPGKNYAFLVVAFESRTIAGERDAIVNAYRNGGQSEVCSFTYKKQENLNFPPINMIPPIAEVIPLNPQGINTIPEDQSAPPIAFNPSDISVDEFLPFLEMQLFSGKLMYKYRSEDAGSPLEFPLANTQIELVVNYALVNTKGEIDWEGYHPNAPKPKEGIFTVPEGEVIATVTTNSQGNFNFFLPEGMDFGKVSDNFKDFWYDEGGNYHDYNDEIGAYSYHSGALYRMVRIRITDEHHEYFLSPKDYIDLDNVGQTVKTYFAHPRSKKLTVTLKTYENEGTNYKEFLEKPAGMRVFLLRKTEMQAKEYFPQADGYHPQSGDEKNEKTKTINNKMYVVVAEAISDGNGVAVFQRVIWQRPDINDYYIFAEPIEGSQVNYYMIAPKKHYTAKYYELSPLNGYSYDNIMEEAIVFAAYPSIVGNVRDAITNQPIQDASISLVEWYDIASGNTLDRDPDFDHSFIEMSMEDLKQESNFADIFSGFLGSSNVNLGYIMPVFLHSATDNSGNYTFKGLFLQVNPSTKQVNGPDRTLIIKAPGYKDVVLEHLNNGTPLRYGQKLDISTKLQPASIVSLTIYDGDSKEKLQNVEVLFAGESKSYLSGSNGWVFMPAKKLQAQKLILRKEGYITDTVTVNVTDDFKNLGDFYLYTLKRRLKVQVYNESGNEYIKGANVQIVEVKTNCSSVIKTGNTGNLSLGNIVTLYECPLNMLTDNAGMATFSFESAGNDNNATFTILVNGPNNAEYEIQQVSSKIPNASSPTYIQIFLKKAACIKGKVYAGETNNSPVGGAIVKMSQTTSMYFFTPYYQGDILITTNTLETTTESSGSFILHNVPIRNYTQTIEGFKSASNLVGDSKSVVISSADNGCYNLDLHLKVFNDMDITNLMGFPMAVTKLSSTDNKSAVVSGYFTDLSAFGNDQFNVVAGKTLSFTDLPINADPQLKNDKGIPVSKPQSLPLKTNENELPIMAYNTQAILKDNKVGVYLDKSSINQIYGVIKGKIQLPSTVIASNDFTFGEPLFLAQPNKSNADKLFIPAIYADKTVKKPISSDKGLLISNIEGKSIKLMVSGFQQGLYADSSSSWFNKDNFTIDAILHTNIKSLSNPDMNLSIKGIKVNKNTGMEPLNSSQEIIAQMDKWQLKSNEWSFDGGGLKLKKFNLYTNGNSGLIVPGTDITIGYDMLNTNLTKVNLASLTIPGGKIIKVLPGNNAGLNYTLLNGKYVWQLYANGINNNTPAAVIENLDGFGTTPFKISSIMLSSDGTQKVIIGNNSILLHGVTKFIPTAYTPLVMENTYMMLGGSLELELGDTKKFPAQLMYKIGTPEPKIESINLNKITFNHHALNVELKDAKISPGLFTAKGFVEEPGVLPKINVGLKYTASNIDILIDEGQKVKINGNDKYFDDVKGEMHVIKAEKKWSIFWFDGIMKGMPGISDVGTPQRLRMNCNGVIEADGQSISVKNVETPFGNMSWTYDMPNASLHGSCILDEFDIGGMKLNGTVETEVGSKGWYFLAGGQVQIPVLGGGNMLSFFGDYDGVPNLSGNPAGLGTYKCLPPAFQSKIKGVLISAGITKNIIDPQDYAIPVIDIGFHAHVTAGLTGRFYTTFGGNEGTNFNLSLMANVSAGGHVDLGCIDVGGDATIEASISGNYNTATEQFSVEGCTSLDINLKGEACLTPLDICPGDMDCCAGCIDVIDYIGISKLTLGAKANANSSGEWDFKFIWESCSQNACK